MLPTSSSESLLFLFLRPKNVGIKILKKYNSTCYFAWV